MSRRPINPKRENIEQLYNDCMAAIVERDNLEKTICDLARANKPYPPELEQRYLASLEKTRDLTIRLMAAHTLSL